MAQPPATFEQLPRELHYKIMQHFTPSELSRYVAPVSKSWRQIANDPLLSNHLTLHCSNISTEGARETLRRHHLILKSLAIRDLVDHKEIVDVLIECNKLTSLTLFKCSFLSAGLISMLTRQLPLIRDLSLERSNVTDSAVSLVAGWKDLKSINLANCPITWDSTIVFLARALKKLQHINIDGLCSISDRAVVALVQGREDSLRTILMDGFSILEDAYYVIAATCPNLTMLGISCACHLTEGIIPSIKMLTKLEYLRINNGHRLLASGLDTLFENSNWSCLTNLNLSTCAKLNDSTVKQIAKNCPDLEKLSLNVCKLVTNVGIDVIVENLAVLRFLSLRSLLRITEEPFVRTPDKLFSHVVSLDLTGCIEVHKRILIHLVNENPGLTIWSSSGQKLVAGCNQ